MEFWNHRGFQHGLEERSAGSRRALLLTSQTCLVVKVWPEKRHSDQQIFVGFLLCISTVLAHGAQE